MDLTRSSMFREVWLFEETLFPHCLSSLPSRFQCLGCLLSRRLAGSRLEFVQKKLKKSCQVLENKHPVAPRASVQSPPVSLSPGLGSLSFSSRKEQGESVLVRQARTFCRRKELLEQTPCLSGLREHHRSCSEGLKSSSRDHGRKFDPSLLMLSTLWIHTYSGQVAAGGGPVHRMRTIYECSLGVKVEKDFPINWALV